MTTDYGDRHKREKRFPPPSNSSFLKESEAKCGLTARVLLCCIRGLDQFSEDVLRLCVKYRDMGVVGMDIAGVGIYSLFFFTFNFSSF